MNAAAGEEGTKEGAPLPSPRSKWILPYRKLAHKWNEQKYVLKRNWDLYTRGRAVLKAVPAPDPGTTRVYKYEPLRSEENCGSFRVLGLFPAKVAEDPLQCLLCELSRDFSARGQKVGYDVLSYVWGDVAEKRKLFCFNKQTVEWQVLYITKNLDEALRALRRRNTLYCIWVDAVCINQKDTREKEQQISLMAEIYEHSDKCIVWLGPGDVRIRRHVQYLRYMPKPISDTNFILQRLYQCLSLHELDTWLDRNEWFTRAWTLPFSQASAVVNKDPLADDRLFRRLANQNFRSLDLEDIAGWRPLLLLLAVEIKARSATEVKDNVMSTTAILRRLGAGSIDFTYDMTPIQLFMAASRTWYALTQSLEIMYLAASDHKIADLPSWCIDWTTNRPGDLSVLFPMYSRLGRYGESARATNGSFYHQSCGSKNDECNLVLKGFVVDEVSTALPSIVASMAGSRQTNEKTVPNQAAGRDQPDADLPLLQCALEVGDSSSGSLTDFPDRATSLCVAIAYLAFIGVIGIDESTIAEQLLILLHTSMSNPSIVTRQHVLTACKIATEVFPSDDKDLRAEVERLRSVGGPIWCILYSLGQRVEFESLFRTSKNRLGFCYCSKKIQPGDKVALVQGSDFPLVLRPTTHEGLPCFTFIGPAQITGMMQGELWPKNMDELEEIVL
ncbi:Heterokaryon incompatibility protein 6, OR allele, partial [Pseudocercospora fuligena]